MLKHETESKILLDLIWAAVHPDADQAMDAVPGCDMKKLTAMIVQQSLVTMIYPVIARQTDDCWKTVKEKLDPIYEREAHKGMVQEYEIQTLLDDMEQDGIDCLPMKGWVMRNYYPEPLMRSMGDLDVLVKDLDSAKMQSWMEARGYQAVHSEEGFHDEYQKSPYMYVELHHTLMDKRWLRPSEALWVDEITPAFWKDSARAEGKKHVFQLSDELFYVHHISHFYKHFTESGVGIRPLIDLYFFLKAKGNSINRAYINQQLEQLHLMNFSKQMEKISLACFKEKPRVDHQTMLVVDYLTHSGIYGNRLTRETLRATHEKQSGKDRAQQFWGRCFLPLGEMKKIYPYLQKYPMLLPVCWLGRIFRIVFLQNYKFGLMKSAQSKDTQENIKAVYRAAGIENNQLR